MHKTVSKDAPMGCNPFYSPQEEADMHAEYRGASLKEFLDEARARCGLTYADLACKIAARDSKGGVPTASFARTIQFMCAGDRPMDVAVRAGLIEILGLTDAEVVRMDTFLVHQPMARLNALPLEMKLEAVRLLDTFLKEASHNG